MLIPFTGRSSLVYLFVLLSMVGTAASLAGCKTISNEFDTTPSNINDSPPPLENTAISGWQDQSHGVHYWDAELDCWRMNYYIWPEYISNKKHPLYSMYGFYAGLPAINWENENWSEPSLEYPSPNVEVHYYQRNPDSLNSFLFYCNWDPISRWGQAASGYRFMPTVNHQLTGQAALVVDFRVPNKPGEESKPMVPPTTPTDTTVYPIVNSYEIKPGADLQGANLNAANLSGLNLENADLDEADLSGADLSGANLRNASLDSALLGQANLSNVQARQATMNEANLVQADLTGAELILVSFYSANLYQAKLVNADLRQADLKFARLIKADLTGANLKDADMEGADLSSAIFSNTIMPDGTIRNQ